MKYEFHFDREPEKTILPLSERQLCHQQKGVKPEATEDVK